MTELEYFEPKFYEVLDDLKDYLDDLTLVGGWIPFVYSRFLWNDRAAKTITTTDVDFGIGEGKTKSYSRTIFNQLSSLNYKERHVQMDRLYPVVFYKEGKFRIDFIAPATIKEEIIEKFVGRQIEINKIDKFEFLLRHRIILGIKAKKEKQIYKVYCPKPSAFLYHKAATFIDRDDEQKKAKDLHYIYFILRYAPALESIFDEVAAYNKEGYFKNVSKNLKKYFERKTSKGCLMVEKEHGPDLYIDDLRQDIFDRFKRLHDSL